MDEHERNKKRCLNGTSGSGRPVYRKDERDQADAKATATMRLPISSSPRDSASRVDAGHGAPMNHPKTILARDLVAVGMITVTYELRRTDIVYSEQKRTSGTVEDGKQVDILEALAFEHMGTRLASIGVAQDQTCRWLFETSEYIQWRQGFWRSRHRFLWIKGKPGSGKSTLMATAYQQASIDFKHSFVASFFFNARGDELSRTTEGMYRTLLHQIFSQLPELPPGIPSRAAASLKRSGWALSILQNMLWTAILHLDSRQSLVCYIDALDECAEDEVRDALQHLEKLRDLAKSRKTKFLVCVASRHYPNITVRYHRAIDLYEQAEHNIDISKYVKSILRVPGTLGTELHDSLMARCHGVFLWVMLTVKSLNKLYDQGGTRSELRSCMREAPNEVQDLFREMVRHRDKHLLPILLWTLFAKRPLTVPELYFAVQSSTGKLSTGVWNSAEIDIPRMQNFLLASSKGLIEFWKSPEDMTSLAQLIHESLREYLLNGGLARLDNSMGSQVRAISHARLSTWCVDYIAADSVRYSASAFGNLLFYPHTLPLLPYVMEKTAEHIEAALAEDAIPYSTLERFTKLWLTCNLEDVGRPPKSAFKGLLYYSLVLHGNKYEKTSLGRAKNFLTEPGTTIGDARPREWYEVDAAERRLRGTYRSAAQAGSIDILRLFSDRRDDDNFKSLVQHALFQAAAEGQEHVLELLLHYVHPKPEWRFCHALLWVAATHLQEGTARVMLRYGTDLNTFTPSVLRSVARSDDPEHYGGNSAQARVNIATMLLDHGADTKGALLSAGKANRFGMMMLLTARGATITRSELRTARGRGREELVEMVSRVGAPVGDSASESAYTSESAASTAAVTGN